jgi:ubiquitin carboxyl-terminal hydrolase 8
MENFNIENVNIKKRGLANLGNTCFMNSILQILSIIPELNNLLNDKSYRNRLNNNINSVLLIEWDLLREAMSEKTNHIISPDRFLNMIHHIAKAKNNNIFVGYQQNDVQELLLFIIDCFHLALKKNVSISVTGIPQTKKDIMAVKCYEKIKQMHENDYSEIIEIFYGVHVSQIFDENENLISLTPETFYSIDLPLPSLNDNKNPTLEECFDLYTSYETMDGENMYFSEALNRKIVVRKNILFWSLPKILVIDIKRFNFRIMKLQQLLNFPLNNLNLSKYIIGYHPEQYVYDLIGICNHSGSVGGGHYTSFVKDNNEWYLCNDTQIIKMNDTENIITPKAYCLFYRKRE